MKKLAKKRIVNGHRVSNTAVHNYLTKCLHALWAIQVAVPAETDRNPEDQAAGFRPEGKNLAHPMPIRQWVFLIDILPAKPPERPHMVAWQLWASCHRDGETTAKNHDVGHDELPWAAIVALASQQPRHLSRKKCSRRRWWHYQYSKRSRRRNNYG